MTARGAAAAFYAEAENYDGDECLLWPFARVRGYAVMRVDGETVYVCRRLMGAPQPGKVVAHRCGQGQHGCVTKRHLRWSTQKDNVADTLAHGTRNRGQRNGRSSLKEREVLEIVELLKGPLTRAAIGERYGITREAVNSIAWGDNWGWLTGL